MIVASHRTNDVIAVLNAIHSTPMEDRPIESTGVKLGRDKSRRRLPHERPRFNDTDERVLRGQKRPDSDEEETPRKGSVTEIRRSKSLHAKATGGGRTPDGERERTLLSWHTNKSQRKKKGAERSTVIEQSTPVDSGTSTKSLAFDAQVHDPSHPPHEGIIAGTSNVDFIQRLVSVIGDIACPVHPDRSIQSCPRECGWHIEHHVERGKFTNDGLDRSLVNRSDSSTLVSSSSFMDPMSINANPKRISPMRFTYGVRPCYILVFLGFLSIAGSLAPAIWRANTQDDLSGGFTLAQYILGVGIFVVGSMVAIHSRTCVCWQSQPS